MAANKLNFSVSQETVSVGKLAYGETYGSEPVNAKTDNKTATGGNVNTPPEAYRYPLKKIENSDDYLEIRIRQYVPPKFDVNNQKINVRSSTELAKERKVETIGRIYLPIPAGIRDTNQVSWGENSMNYFELYGAKAFDNIMTASGDGGFAKQLGTEIGNLFNTAQNLSVAGAGNIVNAKLSADLLNSLGSNVSAQSLLTRASGLVLNPNMELLFQNVNLRQFDFAFDMAPRSKEESLMVKKIIRLLKQSMSPKTTIGGIGNDSVAKGVFVSTPYVFELEYKSGSGTHPFLNKFQPCALINMGVDYTASGQYSTYNDATPVHMRLSLSFKELTPVYFEDYNNLTDEEGVGY